MAGQYRMSTQVRGQPSVPFTSVVNYEPNVPIVVPPPLLVQQTVVSHLPAPVPLLPRSDAVSSVTAALNSNTQFGNAVLFFTGLLPLRLRIRSQSRFFIELLLVLPIHVWVFKLFINHLRFSRWRCCRQFLPHHCRHFYKKRHRPPPNHVLLRRQSHAKRLIVHTTAHHRARAKPALCQNVGLSFAQRMTGKKRRQNETKETKAEKKNC
ncbi:hypothetical protein niasHT_000417 [Heterodera trifolii]|uniref:Uncharacterized protein n=1 Tax=Heterodera trifolii TaxID=157864 RepID=A0ABD2M6D0_9BILA